ncbi:MAG: hypothetical protein JSS24_05025 [Proteobacteria bacterium]|nr:hypothetical protein [Pseudomonadota bacterium]
MAHLVLNRRKVMQGLVGAVAGDMLATAWPEARHEPTAQSDDIVEIGNDLVRACFIKTGGAIRQEFYARAPYGADHAWHLIATSFVPPHPAPPNAMPLYSDQSSARDCRVSAASALTHVSRDEQSGTVELRGELAGAQVRQTVSLGPEARHFHIEVQATLPGAPPRLEYLLSTFAFEAGATPDFTHIPSLTRTADGLSADRVFSAPAVMVQKGAAFVALLPDLDLLNGKIVYAKGARASNIRGGYRLPEDPERQSLPAILDLNLLSGLTSRPLFSFGFADYIIDGHVYWRHESNADAMVRELSDSKLHYGFDLMLGADAKIDSALAGESPTRLVARHQWRRYGTPTLHKPRPQAMPLVEYAKVCFPAAFVYRGDTEEDVKRHTAGEPYDAHKSGPLPGWLEFDLDGMPVGGIRGTPPLGYYDIQFSAWWNNARDAVGLYWWGRRGGDTTLVDKARRIVNLALAAPLQHGAFPAIYRYNERTWIGCYRGVAASGPGYQPAAASLTAAHLLRYHRLCESDKRVIGFAKRYGALLLGQVNSKGLVAGWLEADLKPSAQLQFNAEGGVHAWFFMELYQVTRDSRYLGAAKRLADFLIREILPRQRWADFETFYSCSPKPEDTFDRQTGQWPQNTLSMLWAMQGLSALASSTGDMRYRSAAEAVADYTHFYQACWQPHFIRTAYAFGGFRPQNSDAEWLDMRSSSAAEALLAVARLTHRQDLYERSVAAMRASFAAINHPRHVENDIVRFPCYPIGIEPENIDHAGVSQVPFRSGFDWGEGGALVAAAELQRHCGSVFVDASHDIAVGIDGITVRSFEREAKTLRLELQNQLAMLPYPWTEPHHTHLRVVGLEPGIYRLIVNDDPPRDATDDELQRLPLVLTAPSLKSVSSKSALTS